MMPSKKAHYSYPTDLETVLRIRARIEQGRIAAPFSFCSHCDGGWIKHWDLENVSTWLEMCKHCHGSGRIYLQTEPDFVTRIRALWKRARKWTPPRWLKLTVGAIGCLALIATGRVCLWLWMAL